MFSFKHYLFLFQELNKTLTVLEHYVPRYFKGAFDVYWSKLKNKINDLIVSFSCHQYFHFKLLKHQILFVSTLLASLLLVTFFSFLDEVNIFSKINRNIYKPPVAEETKNIVRKNFTRELEFFDFCKQRLHKQYMALNLNP